MKIHIYHCLLCPMPLCPIYKGKILWFADKYFDLMRHHFCHAGINGHERSRWVYHWSHFITHGVVNKHDLIKYIIWVRSWNCGCLVTWFCYQLIAKPSNKTATVSWPDPSQAFKLIQEAVSKWRCHLISMEILLIKIRPSWVGIPIPGKAIFILKRAQLTLS